MEKHILIKAFLAISLITLVLIGQAQAVSNGKIAFVSQRDGNDEIYTMNANGSNVQRLTYNSVDDMSPAWSPDGTRIAFVSNRDGNYEIYVMNADGSNQQRLTSSNDDDLNPTWSPDGTRIAFATNRDTNGLYYGYEIYVMNTDGSNQQRLTYNSVDDVSPTWSPDGTKIAFATQRDGNYEIYVMNADGSNQQRRTSNTAIDGSPAWSQNGTKIVFVRNYGLYYAEIYIINADACQECSGTPPTDLSNSPSADGDPTFSPDGTRIAFTTNRDGNYEIYTMNPDGTGKTNMTNNTASDWEPGWQPTSVTLLPAISIKDVTLTEPTSGTRNFVFTVTRSGNTTGISSVNFATANGTATAPSDYASNSGTLNFAAGETTKTVTVVVNSDSTVEPDETFLVNLSNCIGCIITDTHGAGTILSGQSVSNGKIAFVSQRDGNDEIYTMNADGSNQQRLTFDPVGSPKSDVNPTWSPDGTRIAFTSNRDGNYEIYVMNADGSNQQRLTSSNDDDINPTWSPDGTRIVFATNRDTNGLYYGYEIYVMNADGSNQQRLTYNSVDDLNPAWSPDGTRIAFRTQRDGNYEIYVMNADGSNQQRMTFNTAVDGSPAWSHDGTRIVFVRNFGLYYADIYIINADTCQECTGTPPTYLSGSSGAEVEPTFSPDGTRIAFATDRDGNYEIYTMNPDGSEQTRVTINTASDRELSWQPTSVTLLPAISINDVTLTEPASGTRSFVFTVTRSGVTTGVSSVKFATANGTATAPFDYVSNSGILNFAAGETTKTVTVVVNSDSTVEPDETFLVNLSNCIGCIITDTHGAGTILSGQSVSNGKIAFVSQRDGNEEIYTMNADGSNVQRLTFDPVGSPKSDVSPTWSPDGTKIAFASNRDGNYEIYVMNANGSNQQRLTSSIYGDLNPTWSPNGTKIAFATNRDTGGLYYGYEIYVMNANGSNQQRLTNNSVDDVNPAWSPDGTRMAFATQRDGNYEIYVMNADGSNQQRMTFNTAVDGNPAWSHDGTRIVFVRNFGLYYAEIYIMNADACQECTGTPPTYLSRSSGAEVDPTFSPDGTRIAFATDKDGNYEIYAMNPDGSEQTRVTTNTASDSEPSWQPILVTPSITVASPNGGETWARGLTQTIKWTYVGNPGSSVIIELMKGGVVNRTINSSTSTGISGSGSYNWLINSTQTLGSDYKVRVTSTTNSAYTDISNNNFTIGVPGITVVSPNGGETWARGLTQTIKWTYIGTPGSFVNITLLKGDVFNRTINSSTSTGSNGSGSYDWLINSTQTLGSDYKIRVTSTSSPAYTDTSNNNFTIGVPGITVVSPNGGETWTRGLTQTIKWTYIGTPGSFVNITLLKGDVFNRTINSSTSTGSSGSGFYNWLINSTQTLGSDYKIRVTSTSSPAYTDTSNNNFTIIAPISCNTSTIYGYSFNDTNSNKTMDSGEIGISNRTINLKGYDTCTRTLVSKIIATNTTGYFEFKSINPGSYVLSEDYILGWLPTTDAAYTLSIPSVSVTIRKDFGNKKFI